MKNYIIRLFSCALLIGASVANSYGAGDGIISTDTYTICSGDSIQVNAKQIQVFRDTILYDTLSVPNPTMDSIKVYVVNVYPSFRKVESRELETGTSFEWRGITITEPGTYTRVFKSVYDCDSTYVMTVTAHQGKKEKEVFFTLCDDESANFNGRVYTNAGTYYQDYTADSVYKIVIVKNPTQIYVQQAVLSATGTYYWQYKEGGETKTDTLTTPGVYEHHTLNPETGCNDIWRLFLTKDDSKYHFMEYKTICENEEFEWRGKTGLNRTGVNQTTHYFDRYTTIAGQDSIYELVLRVNPVPRVSQTVPFCNSIEWHGTTITKDTTIVDTIPSIQFSCDSIITTNYIKVRAFHYHDTATITPGETLIWRGQTITTDGLYTEPHISSLGCDSIYSLGVGLKEAAPVTNTHTDRIDICEGDGFLWRKNTYHNSGTYIDTIFVDNDRSKGVDSLYILILKVHPTYSTRERITFHTFPGTYRGHKFDNPGDEYKFEYTTVAGCDSIITVVAEFELARTEEWQTICYGKTFKWEWNQQVYSETGDYVSTVKDHTGLIDSVEHILHLRVHYVPDTYINKTICEGGSYTFGDQVLTKSGNYTYTFHDTGCDSTVHLSLSVVKADTNIVAHQINPDDFPYVWNNNSYDEAGVYYDYRTNRFGCDSINILELTVNHVDTIDTVATICPDAIPFEWHGISASQSGAFSNVEKQASGNYNFYRLQLSILPIHDKDTSFTICHDGSITFNGKTYSKAGVYTDYLSCDTIIRIRVNKYPQVVHETHARLGNQERGYTWKYMNHGEEQEEEFPNPGTYTFESPNEETGCSEIWRLILTKDETEYHFIDTITICEGDKYSWRGLNDLSHQGIGETTSYYDKYKTHAGKDSIYELRLTVVPVERTVRTIYFCDYITWKGVNYTNSAVVYDTIVVPTGCYRIERINLNKATPFYSYEKKDLPQGTVYHWHGQNITTDGTYYDHNTTIYGCDSVYQIDVTIIPAAPESNQYAEELSACEGDTILWRDRKIWRSGTYVDSIPKGVPNPDSVFVLKFTAWPAPKDTIYQHLYTCEDGAFIRYNGKDYYSNQTIVHTFQTIHGCDSTVKVFLHFNTALYVSDTIEIADTQLPYTWTYRLTDPDPTKIDTVLKASGTYTHITPAEGSCTNKEELVLKVKPTYLFEQDTTICETDLPFYWLNGPADYVNNPLQHAVGETKMYEYRYTSKLFNTDSIYRLNLTIHEQPKRVEQYHFCEGENFIFRGKNYNSEDYIPGKVYRDTTYSASPEDNVCDSMIIFEFTILPVQRSYETKILEYGMELPFIWHEKEINRLGLTPDTIFSSDPNGCYRIEYLNLVKEQREFRELCHLDAAEMPESFKWHDIDLTKVTTGIYRDTAYDETGMITDFFSLELTVHNPVVKPVYIRECKPFGEPYIWPVNGQPYFTDTLFRDTLECDTIFDVHIKLDTSYYITRFDTICEHQLPYIVGNGMEKDSIYRSGWIPEKDLSYKTALGCDSIIHLHLTIIPELKKDRDSIFVCQEFFEDSVITLGDTIYPAFDPFRQKVHEWKGKWIGVQFDHDTIVYNCDSTKSYHIIERPRQKQTVEKNFYLCYDDSIQLFWPHDTTWFYKDTTYEEHTMMDTMWTDSHHNRTYNDFRYTCDSVTIWHIKKLPLYKKDTTAHILEGDSIWWGGLWRYLPGTYDSIAPSPDTNSLGDTCMYIYPLQLIVDTTYHYRDTVALFCTKPNITYTHIWGDGYEQKYNVGTKDTVFRHYSDTLRTKMGYPPRDSIYDLVVSYNLIKDTLLYDTICYGDSIQFDKHHFDSENNTTIERYISKAGEYTDTLRAHNGCDSIITLRLYVRDRIDTTYQTVSITDRELPYVWENKWGGNGQTTVQSHKDSLYISGIYYDTVPSIYGCDSVIVLNLTVRPTYLYRDTVDTCAAINTTLTHYWPADDDIPAYAQKYTTPLKDDTVTYSDTLIMHHPADSIFYELYVRFHRTYETHIYDTICAGDSALIPVYRDASRPLTYYKETGIYHDTLQSISGCDSIITLHLQVWPGFPTQHKRVDIADVDTPYLWIHSWMENGKMVRDTDSLNISGEYSLRLPNIYGCDSIDSLSLFIHKTYYIAEKPITICQDMTPYTWQDHDDITESGTYIFRTQTHDQYDSVRTVQITVLPVLYDTIQAHICSGDSILFGVKYDGSDNYLKQTGVFRDTLVSNQYGCDSIVTLYLNVYSGLRTHSTVAIPDTAAPYVWTHKWIAEDGTPIDSTRYLYAAGEYSIRMINAYGCDSIDSLSLRIFNTYKIEETPITICQSETPYTWQDRDDITESDTYTFYTQTVNGYDSIRTVRITVLPVLYDTATAYICEGDSMRFGLTHKNEERFLHEPGTYYDTLTSNQYGCDSILVLRLNVYPKLHSHKTVHLPDSTKPYEWKHIWYENNVQEDSVELLYASGEYHFTMPSRNGCDSIDSLSLFFYNTYLIREDTITICQSETPYTWQNRDDITETDDYTFYAQTKDGYDSIRTVYIKVLPVLRDTIHESICEGDSLRFGLSKANKPRFLYNNGTYTDTLTSIHGCDSIVTLHLNVYPKSFNRLEQHIQDVDTPYVWKHFNHNGDSIGVDSLYAAGTYGYKFESRFHCDSIDSLTLYIHNTYKFTEEIAICERETPYTWMNRNDITQSGTYYYNPRTKDGYDSIYIATITVIPTKRDTIHEEVCEKDLPFYFHGQWLQKGGIYMDTLTADNGCDSILALHLVVNHSYYHFERRDIYEDSTLMFFDQPLTESGTYTHVSTTPAGCDSISELMLVVHPLVDTIANVCASDLPFAWRNHWNGSVTLLHSPGIYHNDTTYVNGERTFWSIQLNVHKPIFDTTRVAICKGGFYVFRGEQITKAGIYRDTLTAKNGCDSIQTLILTVNEPYFNTRTEHIIEGQSVDFFGESYSTTGTYYHYGTTPTGCDSTSVLQLIVHAKVDTTVTVCSNDLPYLWVNKWDGSVTPLYAAGIYRNDTTFVGNERMYYGLQLNVSDPAFDTTRVAICKGGFYVFRGEQITKAGIYRDTLTAKNGCDSIQTLILTVNEPYFNTRTEHIIEGQSVEFFGESYSTTGTYYHYGTTPTGCDSTSVLQLIVHAKVDTTVTVCSNDLPYLWVNKWDGSVTPLYAAGIYRNDTTFVGNERMYYGLQLNITQPTDTTLYRTICEGEQFYFNDQYITTAGEYRDTLVNAKGCDSVIILHLNVSQRYYHRVEASIYEGDTYMFEGKPYTTAGIYPVRFTSVLNGCDSIIELHLSVNKLYDDSISVCYNSLPFIWRNKTIFEAGVYRDTTVNTEGKQTITGIKVNILPITRLETPIVDTICEGDFYSFHGVQLTEGGTYYDTLTAQNGCDSIVTLVLNVQPVKYQTEKKTIFEGDSIYFYDGTYKKESGIYNYREPIANGKCSDIYQLILTVVKPLNIDTAATVCENELPYIWHGHEYSQTGQYTVPVAWTDTTRITMTLNLTVLPVPRSERTVDLCEGSTFFFKNKEYSTNIIFFDTIPSIEGCDSIIRYIVRFHPTYDRIDTVHISDKQPYTFHGRVLTASGTYEWTGNAAYGCDSIEHLILIVHPSFFQSDTMDICQSDSLNYPYVWKDANERVIASITQSGVYNDSVLTKYGFDSVHRLVVNVHPMYMLNEQFEIGEGEHLKIHGRDISHPAIYYDTLRTIHGCDSIFHVVVNQKRTREFTWDREICQGESYTFFGRTLTHTGQYKYTSQYKDSVVTLNLTVNPISITEKRVVITTKQIPYVYDGKIYNTGGVYNDTLVNRFGCDSIIRLVLVVSPHYSDWDPIPLCPGSEVKIDGDTIRQAGLYTFLRRSRETGEMDSIYRVEVYDAPAFEYDVTHAMCQGDTVFYGDKAITRGGHHDIVLKTTEGCDSVYHLDLTVYPSYHFITDTTITDYQKVEWRGKTYMTTGDYNMSWPTINNCDSTYTLSLLVVPTRRDTLYETICTGQEYTWRGKTYENDGLYTDTVWMPEARYSAIYMLRLTVAYPTTVVSATTGDVCADADGFDIEFQYQGQKPSSYSIYFDALAKREGFQDIINAPLYGEAVAHVDLPKFTNIIYETHPRYVRPDYYSMRIVLDNGVCGLSKSDSVKVLIKYPSWIIEQNWSDVVIPLKADYNGGYEFAQVEWIVDGAPQPSATSGYLLNPNLVAGSQVAMKATRKGESYSIPSCPITIKVPTTTDTGVPVIVYPTQAPKHAPVVKVEAPMNGEYEIFSSTGLLIESGTLEEGTTQLTLPATNGIYFIRTHQGNETTSHKVILY